MAHRVEGPFDFSGYDFTQYADGAAWILTKGEDYHVTSKTLVVNARKWAREQGLHPQHRYIDGKPEQVALRFTALPANVTDIRRPDVAPSLDRRSAYLQHFEALLQNNPQQADRVLRAMLRESKKASGSK